VNLLNEIENMKDTLIKDRRTLHQMPEIGFELDQTCAYIKKRLNELGYTPCDIGNHGIYTTIGEGSPCILLRADMDALPINEESGLPFASTNGHAHACGHDLHMTMLLGACALFKKMKKINGTIKILFQPSEENASGAKAMIEAGILENPHVDAAFSMHIKADQKTGTIHYCPDTLMASSDFFKVVIEGKSAHGSAPHEGIDPIAIAAHTIVNLEMIQSREINAKERFTMTFGKVEAGKANNIIPDEALLEGSIRCFDPDVRIEVLERFEGIISATSDMYNAKAHIDYPMRALTVHNNPDMIKLLTPALKEIAEVDDHCKPLSISEDFSYYSEKVPSLFVLVGAQGDHEPISLHNSAIIFDEKGMKTGIAAYTQAVLSYLKGSEL
jgi:amidohydrolase